MDLHCVYHPDHPVRIVRLEERETLLATGEWYGTPADFPVKKTVEPIVEEPAKIEFKTDVLCETSNVARPGPKRGRPPKSAAL
jgi:hypothetical protein